MSDLTTEREAVKALNQLLAVVVGKRFAIQTDNWRNIPTERINQCHKLIVANEYAEAGGDFKKLAQVKRKIESLDSLNVLSTLIDEIDWG